MANDFLKKSSLGKLALIMIGITSFLIYGFHSSVDSVRLLKKASEYRNAGDQENAYILFKEACLGGGASVSTLSACAMLKDQYGLSQDPDQKSVERRFESLMEEQIQGGLPDSALPNTTRIWFLVLLGGIGYGCFLGTRSVIRFFRSSAKEKLRDPSSDQDCCGKVAPQGAEYCATCGKPISRVA